MNGFLKKPALITILIFTATFFLYVFSKYSTLAFTPINKINSGIKQTERGSIVDRNGKPLAVQTNFYHIGVTPHRIRNLEKFANDVSEALGMKPEEIKSIITQADKASFVYLKKKVDQASYAELKKIADEKNYMFVTFDKIPGRVYPENSLASQVIGYMGEEGKGLAGIEYSMQNQLQPDQSASPLKTTRGKDVYLTLDANLQYKLEEIARDTMKTTQAESMMLLVSDVKSGELLSYISLPSVNLNEYSSAQISETIDRPAMTAYEPGSVFKIFTVASMYDAGLIHAGDSFLCDGVYEHRIRGGETIRIKCLERHGWLTPREALKYSCNDVLAQIASRTTDENFMEMVRRLGFGQRTGIELPSETAGLVKDTNSRSWSARSKPTIAMGQEISVSALQMIQAASALANGGIPVKPAIVKRITNKNGTIEYEHSPEYKERIFKESTAEYLLSCMETTATSGTGARARLHDISIGVKTGTAQMADKTNGGYSTTDFLSNCISIFPIEDPQIILYIVVIKAKGETYAGRIVAPVIAKAADVIIDHLGMSRGDAASLEHNGKIVISSSKPVKLDSKVPDFTGCSMRELLPLFNRSDIKIKINGSGWVKNQSPEPGTPITENMLIELNLE
ncbi:MAG: transpeptidase family protein [Treponema sp.]|nr:transpeptidase family protein [Treponema sp.]